MTNVVRGLIFVAGLYLALVPIPASAGDAQPALEARAVISRQLDAFARDDAAGAYALAAPSLKTVFTDPDVFMAMVRGRYAPVYRHRSVDFGAARLDGDEMAITATLVDADNQVWNALYKLERQSDGQWLITSCMLIKSEQSAL